MKTRLIRLFCIVLCLCAAAQPVLAVEPDVPALTSNMGNHNYINVDRCTDRYDI